VSREIVWTTRYLRRKQTAHRWRWVAACKAVGRKANHCHPFGHIRLKKAYLDVPWHGDGAEEFFRRMVNGDWA
jgi:hypothetical protein